MNHCFKPPLAALILVLLGLIVQPAAAQSPSVPEPSAVVQEAWLVTYAPGTQYWQRFGHNAIWLREPSENLDHVFNFGFFDFRQPNFIGRFLMGRMLYFSAALPAEVEFQQYRSENRSIRVQKLNLDQTAYLKLRDHLVTAIQPANREYLYDYYHDNCSTRVRDALDVALSGAFSGQFSPLPSAQNFRAHTRRSTEMDFWYYLGLEMALGRPIDQPINRWQAMFLPAEVASAALEVETAQGPLVIEDRLEFASAAPEPGATPASVWWRYLLAGMGLAAFFLLLAKFAGPVFATGSALAWLLIAGPIGGMLLFLWFLTDHQAAAVNANVLLFHPLLMLGLLPLLRKTMAAIMWVCAGVALVLLVIPAGQYNTDVLAFVLPLQMLFSWWLWQSADGKKV